MTILALDTSSEFGSLAIRKDDQTAAELALPAPGGYDEVLFAGIGEVLQQAGVTLAQVDCFAAASGPGSFTGVRVALSVVKGLAEAAGKPAFGISNLRVLSSFGTAALRAVAIDARRGEVYGAVYDASLQLVREEAVMAWEAWLETLEGHAVEIICGRGAFCGTVQHTRVAGNLAAAVAACAALAGPQGWQDAALLDANYVRRNDVNLYWEDLR